MSQDKKGSGVEVWGIPSHIPDDRMADKLEIHFLRPRNGGGEVRRVLYPLSHEPGRALVLFQEPDVAARVLQQRPHLLEVDDGRFLLKVKAADRPEVDLPVEFLLDVSVFPDVAALQRLLDSHGFEVTERHARQVRVKGSFMMLRALKAQAERLLETQTLNRSALPSSPPILKDHEAAFGAISKSYSGDGGTVQSKMSPGTPRDSPSHAPRSPPTSPSYGAPGSQNSRVRGASPVRERRPSSREPVGSFGLDTEVPDYSQRPRKSDDAVVPEGRKGKPPAAAVRSGTLSGRMANAGLRNHIPNKESTENILLADLDHESQLSLAMRVLELKGADPLVLIHQVSDTVYLLGPPANTRALKQRLLGKAAEQPPQARPGRAQERVPGRRSSSLPRIRPHAPREGREVERLRGSPAVHGAGEGERRAQRVDGPSSTT